MVSALRMVTELERMGDLSVHVAKIARLRVPDIAVPAEVRPTLARMGEVAEDMVCRVEQIISTKDVEAAIELGRGFTANVAYVDTDLPDGFGAGGTLVGGLRWSF